MTGDQQQGVGVAERMRGDAFGRQRRAAGGCSGGMLGDYHADRVAAEWSSLAGTVHCEHGVGGLAPAFGEPLAHDLDGLAGQGRGAFLPCRQGWAVALLRLLARHLPCVPGRSGIHWSP